MYLLFTSLILLATPQKLILTPLETLGSSGGEITFVDDDHWYTSSGYIVTRWEKNVPREQFHLNAYNYLVATQDKIYGDKAIFDLKTGKKSEIRPELLDHNRGKKGYKSYGLEIDRLMIHPTKPIALVYYNWRPPRGYKYAYPNKKNPLADDWYLIDTKSGKTITSVEKKGYSTPSFSFLDNQFAITGSKDGLIDLYDFKGTLLKSLDTKQGSYINRLLLSKKIVIAVDNRGSIFLFDLKTNKVTTIPVSEKPVSGIVLTSDGKNIIVGDMKGILMVLSGKNFQKKIFETKLPGEIQEIRLNPSGKKLYVGYQNQNRGGGIAVFGVGGE